MSSQDFFGVIIIFLYYFYPLCVLLVCIEVNPLCVITPSVNFALRGSCESDEACGSRCYINARPIPPPRHTASLASTHSTRQRMSGLSRTEWLLSSRKVGECVEGVACCSGDGMCCYYSLLKNMTVISIGLSSKFLVDQ